MAGSSTGLNLGLATNHPPPSALFLHNMSRRLFPSFHGDDQAYIEFLELQLISTQWTGGWEVPTESTIAWVPENTNPTSSACGFDIVQYDPKSSRTGQQVSESAERWKKALQKFIDAIPTAENWCAARAKAGIDTSFKNQLAVRFMLGHTSTAAFAFRPAEEDAIRPSILPTENKDLVIRGYDYAEYIHRWADNLSFKESVVSFQALIFVSYCLVLIQSGVSKETTNNMMRRYFVRNNEDNTLESYRRGVVWIHRCIADLLVKGWGHRSWEVFLLERRSISQFARFAANDARSYETLVKQLGAASMPEHEQNWIPYCIPCIVQSLAGDIIGLERICEILGYNLKARTWVVSSSEKFYNSIQNLAVLPARPFASSGLSILGRDNLPPARP